MDTIIVGVDASDASTRAVEFAVDRAKHNHWKVVLVHVIPWSPFSFQTPEENATRHAAKEKELAAATEHIMKPAAELAEQGGVPHEEYVHHGRPSDTVLDLARNHQAVHIIIGRTGDSGLRAVFGSVASRLVQSSDVPVTVVP